MQQRHANPQAPLWRLSVRSAPTSAGPWGRHPALAGLQSAVTTRIGASSRTVLARSEPPYRLPDYVAAQNLSGRPLAGCGSARTRVVHEAGAAVGVGIVVMRFRCTLVGGRQNLPVLQRVATHPVSAQL